MTFDLGEVLSRAWQITWKNRVLWIFSVLPMIPAIIAFPLVLSFFFSTDFITGTPYFFEDPKFLVLSVISVLFLAAVSFVLQLFSNSATVFGIVHLEEGRGQPAFAEISRGGRNFFWRIAGALLLIGIGTMAFYTVFSACLSLIGLVTFGIGSLIGQFLFLPAMLFIYALIEQTQAAIVADGLRPTDAIAHIWKLIQENMGNVALVTGVLYFGLSLLSSIAMIPVIALMFLVFFSNGFAGVSNSSTIRNALLSVAAFMPVYLVFQAGAMLYIKAAFVVTYLRLTRSLRLQPHPTTVEATS